MEEGSTRTEQCCGPFFCESLPLSYILFSDDSNQFCLILYQYRRGIRDLSLTLNLENLNLELQKTYINFQQCVAGLGAEADLGPLFYEYQRMLAAGFGELDFLSRIFELIYMYPISLAEMPLFHLKFYPCAGDFGH